MLSPVLSIIMKFTMLLMFTDYPLLNSIYSYDAYPFSLTWLHKSLASSLSNVPLISFI